MLAGADLKESAHDIHPRSPCPAVIFEVGLRCEPPAFAALRPVPLVPPPFSRHHHPQHAPKSELTLPWHGPATHDRLPLQSDEQLPLCAER